MNAILFHCTCCKPFSLIKSPPTNLPLSEFYHKELKNLLFCEECDSIRCDQCVLIEITCYYCPNCLFEVPSASVKSEKNTCARNCFQCPQCSHTLSAVASDPDPTIPLTSPAASSGEPPYYLSCNFCRWDSKEVGITFEKPTGLAHQLQKSEDNVPEILEFDHLKDHLEPFIRRGLSSSSTSNSNLLRPHASTSTLAYSSSASHLQSRDSSRYAGTLFGMNSRNTRLGGGGGGTGTGEETKSVRDELEEYKSLNGSNGFGKGKFVDRESEAIDEVKNLVDINKIAKLEQRWTHGFRNSILASDLKPLRTPLHSKLSKRCPTCKHILIKPEQKSTSTRFKIKLVASNYLPSITILRRAPLSSLSNSRLSVVGSTTGSSSRRTPLSSTTTTTTTGARTIGISMEDEPLRPGRTYTFELSFINPLYEPIQVHLAVARPTPLSSSTTSTSTSKEAGTMPPPPSPPSVPPYAVNLPTSSFRIKAHAEEWEYEEEEEEEENPSEDDEMTGGGGRESPSKKRRGGGTAGIVERKGNRTTVIMEVAIGRETVGVIRANMLVTYIYQSDDSSPLPPSPSTSKDESISTSKSLTKKLLALEKEEMKKFSFWTLITLGTVKESNNITTSSSSSNTRRAQGVSSATGAAS